MTIEVLFYLPFFIGQLMITIKVVSAEALPLCLDDKATENASGSQLHAFVEVKVVNTSLRL